MPQLSNSSPAHLWAQSCSSSRSCSVKSVVGKPQRHKVPASADSGYSCRDGQREGSQKHPHPLQHTLPLPSSALPQSAGWFAASFQLVAASFKMTAASLHKQLTADPQKHLSPSFPEALVLPAEWKHITYEFPTHTEVTKSHQTAPWKSC